MEGFVYLGRMVMEGGHLETEVQRQHRYRCDRDVTHKQGVDAGERDRWSEAESTSDTIMPATSGDSSNDRTVPVLVRTGFKRFTRTKWMDRRLADLSKEAEEAGMDGSQQQQEDRSEVG